MSRKESFPTFEDAMAAMQKKPTIGASQGRGPRKDRGAREAAIGTPNYRFSGTDTGDINAEDPSSTEGSEPGGSGGGERASIPE